MSPKIRAERLMSLYQLRAQVAEEIANIEAAINREAAAIRQVRDWTTRPHGLCGTDSGYHHHRRIKKEPACSPCKIAHSAYERARLARRVAS